MSDKLSSGGRSDDFRGGMSGNIARANLSYTSSPCGCGKEDCVVVKEQIVIQSDPVSIDLSRPRLITVNGLLPNGTIKEYHLKVTANKRLLLV